MAQRTSRKSATMRIAGCCTIAAILAALCCTTARAQSRSRADVELGGWLLAGQPGLVMGATGWMSDHSGVAVRGFFVPGFTEYTGGNYRGVEALYRHRGFVRDFEIDFGVGWMFLTAEGSAPSVRGRRSSWTRFPTMDLLVGRRFLERFGLKAGLGFRKGGDFVDLIVKFGVVVPLGSR